MLIFNWFDKQNQVEKSWIVSDPLWGCFHYDELAATWKLFSNKLIAPISCLFSSFTVRDTIKCLKTVNNYLLKGGNEKNFINKLQKTKVKYVIKMRFEETLKKPF